MDKKGYIGLMCMLVGQICFNLQSMLGWPALLWIGLALEVAAIILFALSWTEERKKKNEKK